MQSSINIDGVTGLEVRADINAALETLATNYSGASEPSETFPGQTWNHILTGTGSVIIKQRNNADDAWITIATITDNTYTPANTLSDTDTTVTKQGNTFNGASQLVQMSSDSKLPAIDGSNLTNLPIPSFDQPAYIPYAVNSGAVDSNGYANFISKVDNATVSFTTSPNLVMTYPDGSQETISSLANVASLSNGNPIFVKEKNNSTIQVCTGTITESIVAPSSPSNGDYWLNIGVKPYVPYKRVSGAWVVTQFVKLGECTITSGTMGTPISYVFNGKTKITGPLSANGVPQIVSHKIGCKIILKPELICITPEGGYSIGDTITIFQGEIGYNTFFVNADKLTCGHNNDPSIRTAAKTGSSEFTLTTAYWNVNYYCERAF